VSLTLDHVQNNLCFRDSQRECISYVVVVEDRADEIPRISGLNQQTAAPNGPGYNARHAIILFMYLIEHNSLVARCSSVIYKLDTTSPSLVYTGVHNLLVSPDFSLPNCRGCRLSEGGCAACAGVFSQETPNLPITKTGAPQRLWWSSTTSPLPQERMCTATTTHDGTPAPSHR
jgi:hypothetical protein